MSRIAKLVCAVALAVLGSCASLGGAGDPCTTPEDCEVGLQCFESVCTDTVLTCGEGTTLDVPSGECKLVPRQRCGSHTVEQDGMCVPEPEE